MVESQIKIIVLGDSDCGKTSMLSMFCGDVFPEPKIPPAQVTKFTKDYTVDGIKVALDLWDNSGHDQFDHFRPLVYPNSDAIVVCFSIDCPDSYDNVLAKWIPEVNQYFHTMPIILVGNKSDHRGQSVHSGCMCNLLKPEDGLDMVRKTGATTYVECSALLNEGINEVFDTVTRTALKRRHDPRKIHTSPKCCLLY